MDLSDLIGIGVFLLFVIGPILKAFNKGAQKPGQRPTLNKKPTPGKKVLGKTNEDFKARLEEARRRVQEAMVNETKPPAKPGHNNSGGLSGKTADELSSGRVKPKHVEMPEGLSQSVLAPKHQNLPQGMAGHHKPPSTLSGQANVRHQNLPTGLSGHLGQAKHLNLPKELSGHLNKIGTQAQVETGLDRLEQHQAKHVKFKHHTKALTKKTKKTVKLKGSVIKTDAENIVNGIIWHQILSEPRFKKPWRK